MLSRGQPRKVADYSKMVPVGVSAVFQLIAISARLASMYSEANRGCRELPISLAEAGGCLEYVATAVAPILDSSAESSVGDELLKGNLFEVLVSILDLMGKIEDQLMRNGWGRLWNSNVVGESKLKLGELKLKAIAVGLKKDVTLLKNDVNVLDEDMKETQEEVRQIGGQVAGLGEDFQGLRREMYNFSRYVRKFLIVAFFVLFPCFVAWVLYSDASGNVVPHSRNDLPVLRIGLFKVGSISILCGSEEGAS